MKVIMYDGSIIKCFMVEFGDQSIIFDGCNVVSIKEVIKIVADEEEEETPIEYIDENYDLATEIQKQNGDFPFYSEYDGGFIL